MISQAEHEKAIAAARAEGAAAELSRIQRILTAPECLGREATALQLAVQPGMTLEIARGVLDHSDFGRGREIARSLKR